MTEDTKGGNLFIVDNSISGWTGLRYLQEWTEIAKSFDIATGLFEIGSLLELDGKWQKLEKIRILMGDETTRRTRKALLEAIKSRVAEQLDASLEDSKERNPFLAGVPAIVEALKSGQIECRVYNRDKFHAKAYITHAKLEVVGAQALVGSSNFTRPGLTENVELNIQVQSGREVAQLQEWFETHWEKAEDISPDILLTIERHVTEYSPYEVYAKALYEFFRGHEMTASEWEESRSRMFPRLDRYQKEAYWAVMKIARQHGAAFLCDGVGLGKTFVGLMLIERLILHEGKRVVLLAPKGTREGVWDPHLRQWLPHIGGVGGGADFSNLAVFNHTDLNRGGDFPERFRRISELADVVVIDEAHHFRNPGTEGDPQTREGRSRYYDLYDLLDNSVRPKQLYMLTATPINNRLSDFRHMAELFTRRDEAYFARTLGVNNLRAHFNNMEKALRRVVGSDGADLSEYITEAQQILAADETLRQLVVQRSRAYARESQIRETGTAAAFPERRPPKVADYSIRKTYGRLLDLFEQAFTRTNPLFTLPIYYPLAWYKGEDKSIDPFEENRQKQVVGLIRTQFLKRFESSVCAFELSCDRLMKKLIAFLEVHSETDAEKRRLERWKIQNAEILDYAVQRELQFWGEEEEEDADEDIVPQEFLDVVGRLDRKEYDVVEMMQETFLDLDQIANFLEEARKFQPRHDDKLQKLIRLLRSKDLESQKVLIFTEFADTARYLHRQLRDAGIQGVAQVDSATKGSRADIIQRFSPYYNGTTPAELVRKGREEIRVLISTDVLSEGLNLQDACRMINYDIHWNPVRLMQRIGRVDRRMNPEVEDLMVRDHPEAAASRGKVSFWNFLPPEELNAILTLYSKVTQKTLLISKTLGIEGKKLFRPEDDYEALREFNHAYEGTKKFFDLGLSDGDVKRRFGIDDYERFVIARYRRDNRFDPRLIRRIQYRALDYRYVYYADLIIQRWLIRVHGHMLSPNVGLNVMRQTKAPDWRHVMVSSTPTPAVFVEIKDGSCQFPLYRYTEFEESLFAIGEKRVPNLHEQLVEAWLARMGAWPCWLKNTRSLKETVSPEDILHYSYAVFHCPTYRSRYAEFLKIDFPRLPLTSSLELFRKMARLGGELVALHLVEAPAQQALSARYDKAARAWRHEVAKGQRLPVTLSFNGPEKPVVGKVGWSDDTVWIDAVKPKKDAADAKVNGAVGFRGVPEEVWNFHIGGYQVCEKWLKDRKDRTLTADDIAHYHRIVIALHETIRIMREIDEVIDAHGGWPGAFQGESAAAVDDSQRLLKVAEPRQEYGGEARGDRTSGSRDRQGDEPPTRRGRGKGNR